VLISLSLGFINLLPVPILDGGQVVYQLVEWISRRVRSLVRCGRGGWRCRGGRLLLRLRIGATAGRSQDA
jgi:membrane-associated protease RseP (regulator of RpoE activity)